MKKILSCIVGILLLTSILAWAFNFQSAGCSEPPQTEWSKTYGGSGEDEARSLFVTDDGGFAIAGSTRSFGAGNWDFWLVKTDLNGNMQWNQTYGGTGSDYAYSAIPTSDGEYAITGETWSYGSGSSDFWLVKTDSAGDMLWNQTYGGTGLDFAHSVVETDDGGYAVAGGTKSSGAGGKDFWLVKTDADGNMEWNKTYGGAYDDYAYSVVETDDGGFAIAGGTESSGAGGLDFWLVKTDSAGDMLWNQTYGGTSDDSAYSLIQTSDGGYAIAGYARSFGVGSADFWLVRTDSNGNMQWNQTYGGTDYDRVLSMVQTSDEGYAIVGETGSFGAGHKDFWVVKVDSTGDMEWDKTYGGGSRDKAFSVVKTSDRGYGIAGSTRSFGAGSDDFWLIKLAPVEIPATIDIDPDTLNLKSKGKWITCYIELPEGYGANNVNVSTIVVNDTVPADSEAPTEIGDYDDDGIRDLMVKFNRTEVISYILDNVNVTELIEKKFTTIRLTVTGELYDGTPFQGNDTVKIIMPKAKGRGRHTFLIP